MRTFKAIQIVVSKEHTVPHYQYLVVDQEMRFVCELSECMMRDQPINQSMARRIAAALNATEGMMLDTLETTPTGMAREWFDCWLEQTGGDDASVQTPDPVCHHCGKGRHGCDCEPVCLQTGPMR